MLDPLPNQRERRQPSAYFQNRILDALPAREAERLTPVMRRVFIQRDQVLVHPGEPLAWLHFPIDSLAWAWTETTGTERPTSVHTVGSRGIVEWSHVLETEHGQSCVTVVSPGSAWRLPLDAIERSDGSSGMRRLLLRYTNACILNAACALACNSEHNIDQRLARWLLWIADECGRLDFSITHQQIADVAAIRRPSVSLALSQFQRDGLVRSQHGRLSLLDRARLEAVVCRCYWNMRRNSEAVFR